MLKRHQAQLCRLMSRNICVFWIPCYRTLLISSQRQQFADFLDLDFWESEMWPNVSKLKLNYLHLDSHSTICQIIVWKLSLSRCLGDNSIWGYCTQLYFLFNLQFLYLNFVILKYRGLINKAALIQQGTYWKISKMFNFPRAPFIAAAKRSQFEQFARIFSSKSYSTRLHALP